MKKYYRKFLVYSIADGKKTLLMDFQFFDTYVVKIQKGRKDVETFLELPRAKAIIDTLLMSDFKDIVYEDLEDKKEKTFLDKLKSGEKIII